MRINKPASASPLAPATVASGSDIYVLSPEELIALARHVENGRIWIQGDCPACKGETLAARGQERHYCPACNPAAVIAVVAELGKEYVSL